ncbi:hypothetical protein AAG906_000790 [Vitis piasezkii]
MITMADENEKKIPVFTVLKNNAILKNIFVIDQPPPGISEPERPEHVLEEILMVGRHPDCNIMLTHPSISRFHLQIYSNPTLQKLSVMDLSSVHGTWVSEKKIQPRARVELKEGDTIRLGSSSRIYRLHWVPLSQAYDLENPFVSASDVLMEEEKEDEIYQDVSSFSVDSKEIQSQHPVLKGMESVFSDENCEPFVEKPIPSAPPEPENMNSSASDEEKTEGEGLPVVEAFEEIENQSPSRRDYEQTEILGAVNLLPSAEVLLETRNEQLDEEIKSPQPLFVSEVFSQGETPVGLPTKSWQKSKLLGSLDSYVADDKIEIPLVAEVLEEVENQSPPRKGYEQREASGLHSGAITTEYVNSSVPDRNILSDIGNQQFSNENQPPKPLPVTLGLSDDENPESPPVRLEQKSSLPNIWSRRGKPASVLQIQTGRSTRKSIGDGNGAKIRKPKQEDLENKPISRALFPMLDGEETEIFTPNKENFSPNTLLLKSVNKKKGILEETKQSTLCRSSSSKFSTGPNKCSEEDTSTFSDKENQTPQVLQTRKSVRPSPENSSRNRGQLEKEIMVMKRGAERVPFHSLLENAACKSKSEVSILGAKTRSSNSVNCTGTTGNATNSSFNNSAGEGKRRWNMVVDATCLLNKESRKSLQLLQGLKGTQLIIPRMVIRELDCLKRRGSLFRRISEVSLVLQWIEECMVKTKWWIHVQSSIEEGRPIAPTPPASPPRFSEGSGGFISGTTSSVPFSACGSLMEIVSPTAEDHILECALFFRRIKNDGQLVLLTNDVTLKIKAMAEGLNCETVEEFRESLVNPFSERFMWSDSSPRGQTWSYLDDVVLREKYYRCPLKKASKGGESAKGLKLILLHNSHYGKIGSIS